MTFGFTKYFPTVHVVSEEHTASPDLDAVPAPSNRNREVILQNMLYAQNFKCLFLGRQNSHFR